VNDHEYNDSDVRCIIFMIIVDNNDHDDYDYDRGDDSDDYNV